MDTPRIFIGWDSRMPIASDVLAYSLRKHSSVPLDIKFLKVQELDLKRSFDPLQSTEFTYSRFMVPHLCGYSGTALSKWTGASRPATRARIGRA